MKNIICTNCVMDTTDSKITFDEKGVCDHCNTFHDSKIVLELPSKFDVLT